MLVTSVAQTTSKTAEFARLFDVFDRVASRRARALTGASDASVGQLISADDIAHVPPEFAPVLKNLSTILSLRAQTSTSTGAHHGVGARTLANASSVISAVDNLVPCDGVGNALVDEDEEGIERPSFPLDERYPFTFKLMLHKLYDLDEWAEKVKNVVETSRAQFKPLAERVQNAVRDATASIKAKGEIGSGRSILRMSTKSKSTSPGTMLWCPQPETSRVLKKRCVGRRKSASGPLSTGVWVYDAAISATEVVGPRSAVDADAGVTVENHTRHQSLNALEEMQSRDVARRKTNAVPSIKKKVLKAISPPPPPDSPVKRTQKSAVTGEKDVVKQGSFASVFTLEPCKRTAVKGPLCV